MRSFGKSSSRKKQARPDTAAEKSVSHTEFPFFPRAQIRPEASADLRSHNNEVWLKYRNHSRYADPTWEVQADAPRIYFSESPEDNCRNRQGNLHAEARRHAPRWLPFHSDKRSCTKIMQIRQRQWYTAGKNPSIGSFYSFFSYFFNFLPEKSRERKTPRCSYTAGSFTFSYLSSP